MDAGSLVPLIVNFQFSFAFNPIGGGWSSISAVYAGMGLQHSCIPTAMRLA